MSTIAFLIWAGGVPAVYMHNRNHEFGRFRAAWEALFWPYEMGYTICDRFYTNRDWRQS